MKHTMKIERKNIFYAFLGQTNEKNKEIKTIRCVCWLCEYKCVCAPLYILFVANWRCCDAYNVNMCELNYQSPFLVSTQKCHLKINLIILWDLMSEWIVSIKRWFAVIWFEMWTNGYVCNCIVSFQYSSA